MKHVSRAVMGYTFRDVKKRGRGEIRTRQAQRWAAVLEAPALIWGFGCDFQLLLCLGFSIKPKRDK